MNVPARLGPFKRSRIHVPSISCQGVIALERAAKALGARPAMVAPCVAASLSMERRWPGSWLVAILPVPPLVSVDGGCDLLLHSTGSPWGVLPEEASPRRGEFRERGNAHSIRVYCVPGHFGNVWRRERKNPVNPPASRSRGISVPGWERGNRERLFGISSPPTLSGVMRWDRQAALRASPAVVLKPHGGTRVAS